MNDDDDDDDVWIVYEWKGTFNIIQVNVYFPLQINLFWV